MIKKVSVIAKGWKGNEERRGRQRMTTKDNKRDQKGEDEERREQRKIEGKNRKRQTREKMRMRQGCRHIYTGWEMWKEQKIELKGT